MKKSNIKITHNHICTHVYFFFFFFKSIEHSIRGLTDCKKMKMTTGRCKTVVICFPVTIKPNTKLSQGLLQKEDPFKYMLTEELGQANLDTLISRIRRHGGRNNNPTISPFKFALGSCMMHNGIRTQKHTNCIVVEGSELSITEDNNSNSALESL